MSERKRKKHKHDEVKIQEPSKEELEMAKHVRFKTPKKTTVMQKENIEYFVGSKAVDTLMKSKWAKTTTQRGPAFVSRDDAIIFMEKLLASKLFYRAEKVQKLDKEEKKAKKKPVEEESNTKSSARRRKKDTEETKDEKEESDKKSDTKEGEEKKKKRRYKLQVHEEQIFYDSSDIYVWMYNPLHPRTLLKGGVLLLGVIAATLFPLWPNSVRIIIYYLSVLGGIFVGSVFGVALFRSCLFAFIWAVTLGKHHLWVLPNLLADVGFFDSFKPFYTHEYFGPESENSSKDKDKSSDNEEEKDGDVGANDTDENADAADSPSSDQNSDDSDQNGNVTDPDERASEECETLKNDEKS